jgi:hypothetical protein
MKEIINLYYGGIRRGGFQLRTELHLEPHPFDHARLEALPTDQLFEFVTHRRAEVAKARDLFGLSETWTGPMEGGDPFDPSRRVLATVSVADKDRHAIAQIDALIGRENGDLKQHRETLVVVPVNRLPICTPRRISPLLTAIAKPARRYLVDRVKCEAMSDEPTSLAFSLPEPEHDCGLCTTVGWLRMTVIRAMLHWIARRDLGGYGPRWRPVKPAARPAA